MPCSMLHHIEIALLITPFPDNTIDGPRNRFHVALVQSRNVDTAGTRQVNMELRS